MGQKGGVVVGVFSLILWLGSVEQLPCAEELDLPSCGDVGYSTQQLGLLLTEIDRQKINRGEPGHILLDRELLALAGGESDARLTDIGRGLHVTTESNSSRYLHGVEYVKRGNFERALADFSESVRVQDGECVRLLRGYVHCRLKNWGFALADFNRALEFAPHSATGLCLRAYVNRERGEYVSSVDDYSRVLEHDGSMIPALMGRGLTYWKQQAYDKSLTDFSDAIQLAPNNTWALRQRASLHLARGHLANAYADCGRALQIEGDTLAAHGMRARAALLRGDAQQALRELQAAENSDPKNRLVHRERAFVSVLLEGREDVEGRADTELSSTEVAEFPHQFAGVSPPDVLEITLLIHHYPGRARLYASRASRNADSDDISHLKSALRDASTAIRLAPQYSGAWVLRGNIRWALGDHDGAIHDCTKACTISPDDWLAYSVRGNVWGATGRWRQAIEDATTAIRLNPNKPMPYLVRAAAHIGLWQVIEASIDVDDALRVAPEHEEAKKLRNLVDSLMLDLDTLHAKAREAE